MKKAKRIIFWIVVNVLFALALWFGYVGHIDGARRVADFYVGFSFFGSFVVFSDKVKADMRARGPAVSPWVDGLFDATAALFLVWHGALGLATVYVLHSLFIHGTYASEVPAVADTAHA